MKKSLSLVLSVIMLMSFAMFSAPSVSAVGNKAMIVETNTEYASFLAALGALKDGQTLKLLADDNAVYMGGNITNWAGAKTIDLNGFTLTCTSERFLSPGGGSTNWSFIIKNGTLQNMATVKFQSFFMIRANVTITLDNVTLNDVATSKTNGYGFIGTVTDKSGVLNFKNCTVTEVAKPASYGYNVAGSKVNFYNTAVTAASPIFYTNSTYTVYSGAFVATDGATLATPTLAANSVATTQESAKLVVKCNHRYIDGVCEYCGAKIISMSKGASMRLSEVSGLRYYTNVDVEGLEALKADGYTVEMGTLIAPVDLLGGAQLTLDTPEASCVNVAYEADELYTEDGFSGIVGSLAEIQDKNCNRDFVGRGYLKLTKDGDTTVVYADYAGGLIANNTRTISYIATILKADDADAYNALAADKQDVVDYYAAKYIA